MGVRGRLAVSRHRRPSGGVGDGAQAGDAHDIRRGDPRLRLGLALGLLLGLPVGLTAASWADAETVGGTFTASRFGIETNLAGAGWSSASTVSTAVSGVYPGGGAGSAYVALRVRTTADSASGTVRLSADANTAGLGAGLVYRIVRTSGGCSAAEFTGSPTWVVGGASSSQPLASTLAPTAPLALAAAGGSPVELCVEYALPTTASATLAGTTTTAVLQLTGSSS